MEGSSYSSASERSARGGHRTRSFGGAAPQEQLCLWTCQAREDASSFGAALCRSVDLVSGAPCALEELLEPGAGQARCARVAAAREQLRIRLGRLSPHPRRDCRPGVGEDCCSQEGYFEDGDGFEGERLEELQHTQAVTGLCSDGP